ncbi:hypothetical protein D3C83_143390 [compost metagenome]
MTVGGGFGKTICAGGAFGGGFGGRVSCTAPGVKNCARAGVPENTAASATTSKAARYDCRGRMEIGMLKASGKCNRGWRD